MAGIGVKVSKPKTVTGGSDREFVLGSRPPDVYSPRIKPLSGMTQYGKQGSTERQANPAGISSGVTNRPGF